MTIEFTPEQQEVVDKLVGTARIKARELAETEQAKAKEDAAAQTLATNEKWQELATQREARIKELEPLEGQAKAYGELVASMLTDRLKSLGKSAEKAVKALPETMTTGEKLNWLSANEALFQGQAVGTPKRSQVGKTEKIEQISKYPLIL